MPIVATVYVYPGPKDFALVPAPKQGNVTDSLLSQHFETCRRELLRSHPEAKLVSGGPYEFVQGEKTFHGKKAVYSIDYQFGLFKEKALSELELFVIEPGVKFLLTDRHFVKYRITYPEGKKNSGAG